MSSTIKNKFTLITLVIEYMSECIMYSIIKAYSMYGNYYIFVIVYELLMIKTYTSCECS